MRAHTFRDLERAPRFTAVHRFRWEGEEFLLGETHAGRSLYAASGDAAHFDLEGRWQRARLGESSYLRGYDGLVLRRLVGPDGEDERVADPGPVHRRVAALVQHVAPAAEGALDAAAAWCPERLAGEAQRFLGVYRPVGVLPPDRYRSLLLQATRGCSYNGCLFCNLYKGQPFATLDPEAFRAHVRGVKTFLGSGLEGRRGVFLGEANALGAPLPSLLAYFEVLAAEVPELLVGHGPSRGVSSFIDAFSVCPPVEALRELHRRGLSRVFLGVESGHPGTLALLGKPAGPEAARAVVGALHQAGVTVGLTLLVGLGEEHLRASAALLKSLELTHDDVVYLSPLRLDAEGPLARQLTARGFQAPSREAVHGEYARLRMALAGLPCHVARYDVNRFVYC